MIRKIIVFLILSITGSVYCMDQKAKAERKRTFSQLDNIPDSDSSNDERNKKQKKEIENGILKKHFDSEYVKNIHNSTNLVADLCRIIGEYDGYRLYCQFDEQNGGHNRPVSALAYCQGVKLLASGSWDTTIKIWDLDKNSESFKTCIATFGKARLSGEDQIRKL